MWFVNEQNPSEHVLKHLAELLKQWIPEMLFTEAFLNPTIANTVKNIDNFYYLLAFSWKPVPHRKYFPMAKFGFFFFFLKKAFHAWGEVFNYIRL